MWAKLRATYTPVQYAPSLPVFTFIFSTVTLRSDCSSSRHTATPHSASAPRYRQDLSEALKCTVLSTEELALVTFGRRKAHKSGGADTVQTSSWRPNPVGSLGGSKDLLRYQSATRQRGRQCPQ